MTTRAELMGKELGLNQWGNMTYDRGWLAEYLPGEYDYHGSNGEGYFLASLCLYLLSENTAPSSFFTQKDDYLFLEHFVFKNIPKETFLAKMSEYTDEKQKVAAICSLIKSDILLSTNIRFHDFYINGYQQVVSAINDRQKIQYCQCLLELFKKDKENTNWIPPYTWDNFSELYKQHQLSFTSPKETTPQETIPTTPVKTLDDLLTSYLKQRAAVVDPETGKTKDYFHSIFVPFQKSFQQKSDAVEALKRALTGEKVDLDKHLSTLRNGKLGQDLRAFIKSGQADELVGNKKVRTVREFVGALEAKMLASNTNSI
ncbi:hypothetical protein [Legionella cardiaca]|uniref:Uncharacterized protein n=1 Tax=Legionella cardiaca TaxID=1071983 RepID=A0ABY8ASU1_9GAMM|nr:hypothetical protein [Legionella cardiaca]WED42366.1 hypothetical protein PXX05_10600 [Legionella cardiaca]